ncbi:Carboxylesterase NlhH [Cytospora mali]|uniref:Carboxylesterase NlhH n=1 Tax=Cytospora mali TaxID=578113 RepID=A0A194V2H8_CYTMA|nr:Carboxylesterase NlhH [Valsa mali var. pyri (nom. inval.)]
MTADGSKLSLWEAVSLTWRVPLIHVKAFKGLLSTILWSNPWPSLAWQQRLAIIFLRVVQFESPLSPNQSAWCRGTTTTRQSLKEYSQKAKLEYTAKEISTTTSGDNYPQAGLHFITPPSAPENGPTLFYLHGGGYEFPILPAIHIPLVFKWAQACKARQIVFLEYGLTPTYAYPTQLVQAVAGLHHLLEVAGLLPSELILGGDSAGGGMVASLLVHLIKPCPYAAPVDLKGDRFKGVFLTSPWVVMGTNQPSYDQNIRTDWESRELIQKYTAIWKPKMDEVWAAPCETKDAAEVWDAAFPASGQSTVAAKVLVTAGMGEVLHDGILRFATDFIRAKAIVSELDMDFVVVMEESCVLVRCPDETHVQPGVDLAMKYDKGSSMRATTTWLERL